MCSTLLLSSTLIICSWCGLPAKNVGVLLAYDRATVTEYYDDYEDNAEFHARHIRGEVFLESWEHWRPATKPEISARILAVRWLKDRYSEVLGRATPDVVALVGFTGHLVPEKTTGVNPPERMRK